MNVQPFCGDIKDMRKFNDNLFNICTLLCVLWQDMLELLSKNVLMKENAAGIQFIHQLVYLIN